MIALAEDEASLMSRMVG